MAGLEFVDIAQSVCFARNVLTENRKDGSLKNTSNPNDLRNKRRPWLTGPLPLSCEGCRFELPMDLKILENLSAIKYLSHYCIVSSRRKYLFKTTFVKTDKDLDGIINSYELRQALIDLYSNSIGDECLDDILDIIDCKMESVFDRRQFLAISAFSERYLCTRYQDKKEISNSKHLLEQTDFAGLKSKLEGYNIASNLVKMLLII
ncbi:uncharacterized protein LOC114524630 [Dendronephthya gigantea]|uniref:uncharacterized protein LOC114524630 n=1 Tax=Dendronephthya gigantea TaxID=151771 RepID=UPI00106B0070|nr:uncharacterized protein LOC114524630 [Dendronephthya gigantea]